jgi:hypothetical protein
MTLMRLTLSSFVVGALVAFGAMLSVEVVLPWNEYANVVDAPREKLSQLSHGELNNQLLKGTIALKAVNGVQKVFYILSHSPMYFAYQWAYFFVPSVVAAFIGGLIVRWRCAP